MNYSEQIFKLLNIKPNEEFKIIEEDIICRIDENLDVWAIKDGCYPWTKCSNSRLQRLLNGTDKITKLPKLPTKEDEIVIAYAKLCGFNWLAKDKNGQTCGYCTKPSKDGCFWDTEGGFSQLCANVSFLSWDDEEPYYISIEEPKNYETEIQYIDKLITKAELSLERAENKPNVSGLEILDLKKKLIILNNIKNKLNS